MERLGPAIRSKIWGILLDQHKRNLEDNKLVLLRLTAENAHGARELEIYKQNLLPVTLSICRESRAYTLERIPNPMISGKGVIDVDNDILVFGAEGIELYQTAPLQQIAGIKAVAVNARSICEDETLSELLMTIYSRLRNIETIIIVVHRLHPSHISCRNLPLGVSRIPADTAILNDENWSDWGALGWKIQLIIQIRDFWLECNGCYALEQIPPVEIGRVRVPKISLMQVARCCSHEVAPRGAPWVTDCVYPPVSVLALEELWEPSLLMAFPEAGLLDDYSLRHLLP